MNNEELIAEVRRRLEAPTPADALEGESLRRLRDAVARRWQEIKSERQRLFDDVLHGEAKNAQPGWYVAPVHEVQAKAKANGKVQVTVLPDGTFTLSLKADAIPEEPLLSHFIRQQFADASLAAVEWALSTNELADEEIDGARERMAAIYAGGRVQESKIWGLYLLNAARVHCRKGFDRAAYQTASQAADLFERLQAAHPDDADLAAMLEAAQKAQWTYDW